jgi:hypothetical protein
LRNFYFRPKSLGVNRMLYIVYWQFRYPIEASASDWVLTSFNWFPLPFSLPSGGWIKSLNLTSSNQVYFQLNCWTWDSSWEFWRLYLILKDMASMRRKSYSLNWYDWSNDDTSQSDRYFMIKRYANAYLILIFIASDWSTSEYRINYFKNFIYEVIFQS